MQARTRTRNTDPDIMRLSGLLGPLTRDGRNEEAAAVREQLDRAKRMAAIRSAVSNAPPLSPAELGGIVSMLASAVTDD